MSSVFQDIREQIAHPTDAWIGQERPPARRRLAMAVVITGGLTLSALLVGAGYFLGLMVAA